MSSFNLDSFVVFQTFKLLGILDVENTPCARDSILYGSLGSAVSGLGHFLFTSEYLLMYTNIFTCTGVSLRRDSIIHHSGYASLTGRIRRSCDVGVGGFILVTLGCWYVISSQENLCSPIQNHFPPRESDPQGSTLTLYKDLFMQNLFQEAK